MKYAFYISIVLTGILVLLLSQGTLSARWNVVLQIQGWITLLITWIYFFRAVFPTTFLGKLLMKMIGRIKDGG